MLPFFIIQCSDLSFLELGGNQKSGTIGLAVVVTLNYDWDGSKMSPLLGTDADEKSWKKALEELKFDVRVVKNEEVTAEKIQEMIKFLQEVELNEECKYLAFVFAGHGSKDSIYLNKRVPVNVNESILNPLIYHKKREEQGKLFFFDCCREHSLPEFVLSPMSDIKKRQEEVTRGPSPVVGSNYFIAYATLKYTKARENPQNGGYFSSTVTRWIVKKEPLESMLGKVAEEMQRDYQQVPQRISTIVGRINLREDADALGEFKLSLSEACDIFVNMHVYVCMFVHSSMCT